MSDEHTHNYFNETCWVKLVFGPPYSYVTQCCHTEDLCDYHKPIGP